jgi:quercetin dioxygenase-like cupin family protein
MKLRNILAVFAGVAILSAQSGSKAVVINFETANWTEEKGGAASVLIRTDPATGGMDLLARYPAGHVIAPHSHDSNERLFVAEGQLTLAQPAGDAHIDAGGFAFLPAHEVQRLSCTSKTRCSFYLSWDGNPKSIPAK